jgi:ATP-binding cassette subfamily F protein 3
VEKSIGQPPGALKKERDKQVRAIERKIAACEQHISDLDSQVFEANEKISAGQTDSELLKKMALDSQKLLELETEWLSLSAELEKIKDQV